MTESRMLHQNRLRSSIHQIRTYEKISSDLFKLWSNPVYHIYCCYTEFTNHASVDMYNRKVWCFTRNGIWNIKTDRKAMHIDMIDIIINCVLWSINYVPVDMYNRNVDVSPETVSETSNQIEKPCTENIIWYDANFNSLYYLISFNMFNQIKT
jgi:hypothetical protein